MNIHKKPIGPVNCSNCSITDLVAAVNERLAESPRVGFTINCLNAHIFNLCWKNTTVRERMNGSDIVAADGIAIIWAAKLFGYSISSRCNMTDSFRAFLADKNSPKANAILIGGTQDQTERAAKAITRDGPHVTITQSISGYLSADEYEQRFREIKQPDLVLVGMGTPRSEQLIERAHRKWPSSIIWHIGGGTILFFAGDKNEAPEWMRKCGLQWLHRLIMEPCRMWRRYVLGNPLFVIRVIRSAFFKGGPRIENKSGHCDAP